MLAEIQKIWLSHLALRKLALKQCCVEWITLWTAFSLCLFVAYVSSHSYSWEVRDRVLHCRDPLVVCCRDAKSLLPHLDQTHLQHSYSSGIQVTGNTGCFCRVKSSVHILCQAILQLAACLNFLQYCSPQALGFHICSEGAVKKSTFLIIAPQHVFSASGI